MNAIAAHGSVYATRTHAYSPLFVIFFQQNLTDKQMQNLSG